MEEENSKRSIRFYSAWSRREGISANTADELFLKDAHDLAGEGEASGDVCLELRAAWRCSVSSTRWEWLKSRKRYADAKCFRICLD